MSALLRSRAASILGFIIAAALLLAMRMTTPNYDGRVAPIVERGRIGGDYAIGRRFAARAERVEAAQRIRVARLGATLEERDTSGVWIIVHASAMAMREPTTIGAASLRTRDGRRYAQTARLPSVAPLMSTRELQPAIADSGVFVFELPADAVAGATLVLAANRIDPLDSELQIDLGLTAAPAARDVYDLVRP
ncbi:MAG TPA: hypothetical protein VLF18_07970 [Tahibacter sp.]|uniref:hypothetical protein n=1 Tax=Tahibacter sp. TaxID=2056211 RepID=UPI002D1D78DB|nr:hypothetical protein [Tahibacter sp.]HSX60118.1 hypothetical protein [Tahibacter sp.]